MRGEVVAVDPEKRTMKLASGDSLSYDRLVLTPGIDFMYDQIPSLNNASAQEKIPHAWKAGAQTVVLRKQLKAMKDGGVYAMNIPRNRPSVARRGHTSAPARWLITLSPTSLSLRC